MSRFSDALPIQGSVLDVTMRYSVAFQPDSFGSLPRAREQCLAAIRDGGLGLEARTPDNSV